MKRLKYEISTYFRGLKLIEQMSPRILFYFLGGTVFEGMAPFVNISATAAVINGVIAGKPAGTLLLYAGIAVGASLALAAIIHFFWYNRLWRADVMWQNYTMLLDSKAMRLDYAQVENPRIQQMRTTLDEIHKLNRFGIIPLLWRSATPICRSLVTIGCSIILMYHMFLVLPMENMSGMIWFVASPWASALLAVAILTCAVWDVRTNSKFSERSFRLMDILFPINRIFQYYVDHFFINYHCGKDVRLYHQQELLERESNPEEQTKAFIKDVEKVEGRQKVLLAISSGLLSLLIYLIISFRAWAGLIAVGSVIQFIGCVMEFVRGFSTLVEQVALGVQNNKVMQKHLDYVNYPPKMKRGTLHVEKQPGGEYDLEFHNVSFKYPNSEISALKNISIKLKIGKRMAVVGMNGSGKTTFIKLLCRLYDPTEGKITLNGIDIREYDYEEYLTIFSVVFQDFHLFSFLLGQNVAADKTYDSDKTLECLVAAGMGAWVESLPDGLDTPLYRDFDESGIELSGGERQKIALARALYKDAPLIILDEPTSALDPVSEFEIYSKFNEIVGEKTVIFISHRLSSCRFSDCIFVFDKGKLIQQGTHDALLLSKDGKYHRLWSAQAQYYTEK